MQEKPIFLTIILTVLLLIFLATTSLAENNTKSFKKGEAVFLGTYEQDNNTENGEEAIEWLVLDYTGGGDVILYSRYVLDAKPYNESGKRVKWEETSLYAWLNNEFKNDAFSAEEIASIKQVSIMGFDELLINIPVAKYGVDATPYFIANNSNLYDTDKHYVTQWCLGPAMFAKDTVKPFVVYGNTAQTDALDGYGKIDDVYGIRPEIIISHDALQKTERAEEKMSNIEKSGEIPSTILPYSDLSDTKWDESIAKINASFMVIDYVSSLSGDEFSDTLRSVINNGVTVLIEGSAYTVVWPKSEFEAYSLTYRNHEWTMRWNIYKSNVSSIIAELNGEDTHESFTISGNGMYSAIVYLLNEMGRN